MHEEFDIFRGNGANLDAGAKRAGAELSLLLRSGKRMQLHDGTGFIHRRLCIAWGVFGQELFGNIFEAAREIFVVLRTAQMKSTTQREGRNERGE